MALSLQTALNYSTITSSPKLEAVYVFVCVCVTSDLSLDHGWPLCPEHLHCLEDINHAFIAHSLQDDAEGDEDSGPAHASTRNTYSQLIRTLKICLAYAQ